MAVEPRPGRRSDAAIAAGGVLMVLCCAVGPAVIGAVAGSAVGGWLGIVCAVILAAVVGLVVHRRTRRRGGGAC
jgi:outer membrane lipoprotein SlyB